MSPGSRARQILSLVRSNENNNNMENYETAADDQKIGDLSPGLSDLPSTSGINDNVKSTDNKQSNFNILKRCDSLSILVDDHCEQANEATENDQDTPQECDSQIIFDIDSPISPEEPFSPASTDNEYIPSSSSSDTSENEIQGEAQATTSILQPRKRKIFQLKEKLSKKKTRNEAEWKQNRNSILRQAGKEYVTRKGKNMESKNPKTGILCKATCKYKCHEKFCDIDCASLFSQYYSLKNNTEKNMFLSKFITAENVKRALTNPKRKRCTTYTYVLPKEGTNIKVCKPAFSNMFQIGYRKLAVIQSKIQLNDVAGLRDQRGKTHTYKHRLDVDVENYICSHIRSFPSESSHYSRTQNIHKQYLNPLLTIKIMYSMYIKKCEDENKTTKYYIRECTYRKLFNTKFNLSFKQPRTDVCCKCDSNTHTEEHLENYKRAFELQKQEREMCMNGQNKTYISFDMQQTQPLPKIPVSKAFYLRQIWFYNEGIHIVNKNGHKSYFCTWTEDCGGKGSVEVLSSLFYCLNNLANLDSSQHLLLWSDSCSGQNKNQFLIVLYQYMIARKLFASIEHKFPELQISSSNSESEPELTKALEVEDNEPEELEVKKNKKRRKHKKNKTIARSSSKEKPEELDEIDKSVKEVNELLGTPPVASVSAELPAPDPEQELMSVQYNHLNVTYELKKKFGQDSGDEGQRRGRQTNLMNKGVLIPVRDTSINFHKYGLSMSINRRENGFTYFTFDHNKKYRAIQETFLQIHKGLENNPGIYDHAFTAHIAESRENMHVEGLLENADMLFHIEEYTPANDTVEAIIAFMQAVSHHSFNLTNRKTRLEYKFQENRPFHIALLKYLHLLTNRACHRTALELCKLSLNLDPSDPLAILLVVDTIALRAREHQWLISAIEYWSKQRIAGLMFNMQYSYALAKFHVALKDASGAHKSQKVKKTRLFGPTMANDARQSGSSKSKIVESADLAEADSLLQGAIMRFPLIVPKLLEFANVTSAKHLFDLTLFKTVAENSTTKDIKELMSFYCKFTCGKWREPAVLEWLLRNASALAEKYDQESATRDKVAHMIRISQTLYHTNPPEVVQHLSIVKPMANLLVDGVVPNGTRCLASDPQPPADTVNRYHYGQTADNLSLFEQFFTSMMPGYMSNAIQRILRRDHAYALNNGDEVRGQERDGAGGVEEDFAHFIRQFVDLVHDNGHQEHDQEQPPPNQQDN